ncbi:MAG: FKBP-type peptidyl-prolyl cis-trans isomerase SlyD [Pseudohongiellaceae bacterium]
MKISKHAVTSLDYTLTDDDGEVLDTSEGESPLVYIHGTDSLIPALEKELDGKTVGDSLKVHIQAEEAYGARDDNMLQTVPRTELPTEVELEVGMQFQAESEDGVHIVTVSAIVDDEVVIDGNHPLAGVNLNFDVKVAEVREATAEELEHGHAHDAGGCGSHE